jgi:acyl-CoA synthetase (NDP forming)
MTIDRTLRKAFLQPGSVALVGASPDPKKNNSRPQRFLKRFGYSGRVLPINPSRAEVLGEQAYPDLKSAPGPIDHAFIMVPAAAVPGVIDQCCELRIPRRNDIQRGIRRARRGRAQAAARYGRQSTRCRAAAARTQLHGSRQRA